MKREGVPEAAPNREEEIARALPRALEITKSLNKMIRLTESRRENLPKIRSQFDELATYIPYCVLAFGYKKLLPTALEIAFETIHIPLVGPHLHNAVAANAERIVEYIQTNPKKMSLPLTVLALTEEQFSLQADLEKGNDSRRRSGKIIQAVQKAVPSIKSYFMDSAPSSERELTSRTLSLASFAYLTTIRGKIDPWILDSFSSLIHDIVMSENYYSGKDTDTFDVHSYYRERVLSSIKAIAGGQRINLYLRIFKSFGLPPEYFSAGKSTKGLQYPLPNVIQQTGVDPTDKMVDQLEAIRALEKERPGAAAVLYEKYGIRFFSRYPTELLVCQYDTRDTPTPYGIVIVGVSDHNNALFSEHNKELYRKLGRESASVGHVVRFSEASTLAELEDRLRFFGGSYAEKQKAAFLLFQGHGSLWTMQLGQDEDTGHLRFSDLEKHKFSQFKEIFEPGYQTVFDGCSIGRRGGLAQEWSRVFDSTVYAPKGVESSLVSLGLTKEGGKLVLTPGYEVETTKVTPAHLYKSGRKRKDGDLPK